MSPSPSDQNVDPEALSVVEERQVDDTTEKQCHDRNNTKTLSVLTRYSTSPSSHLSSSRELWESFRKVVVDVSYQSQEGG